MEYTDVSFLKGSFVALITPFDDAGEVDYLSLEKLLLWHLKNGTDGFVICGTTGEFPTLADDEKYQILKFVKSKIPATIPLVMGAGCNCTRKTIQQVQMAKEYGATAALISLPYYNLPNFQGCYAHFLELNKLGFPLILYHHPKRTGILFTTDEIKKLMEIENIVALKESCSDPERILELNDKPVFCGEDSQIILFIQNGAIGSISTFANILPKEFSKIVHQSLSQDLFSAKRLFDKYKNLFHAVFSEVNPQGVKFALSCLEMCKPHLRLPLMVPNQENQKKITTELRELQLIPEPVQ